MYFGPSTRYPPLPRVDCSSRRNSQEEEEGKPGRKSRPHGARCLDAAESHLPLPVMALLRLFMCVCVCVYHSYVCMYLTKRSLPPQYERVSFAGADAGVSGLGAAGGFSPIWDVSPLAAPSPSLMDADPIAHASLWITHG